MKKILLLAVFASALASVFMCGCEKVEEKNFNRSVVGTKWYRYGSWAETVMYQGEVKYYYDFVEKTGEHQYGEYGIVNEYVTIDDSLAISTLTPFNTYTYETYLGLLHIKTSENYTRTYHFEKGRFDMDYKFEGEGETYFKVDE